MFQLQVRFLLPAAGILVAACGPDGNDIVACEPESEEITVADGIDYWTDLRGSDADLLVAGLGVKFTWYLEPYSSFGDEGSLTVTAGTGVAERFWIPQGTPGCEGIEGLEWTETPISVHLFDADGQILVEATPRLRGDQYDRQFRVDGREEPVTGLIADEVMAREGIQVAFKLEPFDKLEYWVSTAGETSVRPMLQIREK